MVERGVDRLMKYEEDLEDVQMPVIDINGAGRFSIPKLGGGNIAGNGRISPEEVVVNGAGYLPGGIKVNSVRASGSVTFRGDLKAEKMRLMGSTNVHGGVYFNEITTSGSIKIGGNAIGNTMKVNGSGSFGENIELGRSLVIDGSMTVGGEITAKEFVELDGSMDVDGKLTTGAFNAELCLYRSHIEGGIEAESVDIRKGYRRVWTPRFILRLVTGKRGEGDLRTTDITAKTSVYLENVICENVTGGDVTLGEGCEIRGRVRYLGSMDVHADALVHNPPEKI
ncbi:MAG: hypothetical protein JSV27_06850 [Candidatus Bathyarchaeota archaeon]|nr:MAG: hypothetical protein JSV27_06850 [Candidatus Bathyarchaeota archaeon]